MTNMFNNNLIESYSESKQTKPIDNRPEHIRFFEKHGWEIVKESSFLNPTYDLEYLFQMFKARLLSETGDKDGME